jgi:hypothetical protein
MGDVKLRGDRCRCTACNELFNSTYVFDLHRVGKYPARRCLSSDEMGGRGYSKNAHGFWVSSQRSEFTKRQITGAAINADPLPAQGVGS